MKSAVSKIALVGIAAFAAACAGRIPPPTDRLASSEAAIRSAKELGAESDPQAALHVRLADEQVGIARQFMQHDENRRADLVLQRSKADAELAIMLTRERAAKTASQGAAKDLNSQKKGDQ